ncbi:MAG: polysaccharide biosynthesis protein [Cereibacter sphaeroides]|uniref:Polysaccharide biosynthesis protein n=1 Tax=Cereibacter sphaeroides TaxID=1063 RepID=A0A2W5S413_CERSP|nr:MAG: polysaccharide biosynthesis protein [Cereibacter sphaeroides]
MIAINHVTPNCAALVEGLTRDAKRRILLGLDVVCVILGFVLTLYLEPADRPISPLAIFGLAIIATCASIALGLHRMKLNDFDGHGLWRAAAVALIVAVGLRAVERLAPHGVTPLAIVLFGFATFFALVFARLLLLRLYEGILHRHHPRTPVVIYGAGDTGLQLGAALRHHDSVRPVAFVDDNPLLHGMTVGGLSVHGRSALHRLARENDLDHVIIAMPDLATARQAHLTKELSDEGFKVQTVPSFAQLIGQGPTVDASTSFAPSQFLSRAALSPPVDTLSAYSRRVVMVTGAGGSIGAELCRQLLFCNPAKLILLDISEAALYAIDKDLRADRPDLPIVPVLGSVTDARLLRDLLSHHRVEVIFHAAAYKHVPLVEANPLAAIANNALGTRILAQEAAAVGVARFVLISTDKAVRPGNVMGATKRLAELAVQDLGSSPGATRFAIVRFGNVLGSSGSVLPLFREQIGRGGPVTLTHPEATRYFMTITEAGRLVLAAGAFEPEEGWLGADVFMLDMGMPRRIRDLAVQMIQSAGYTVRDEVNPKGEIEIRTIGLRPGEKLHEELLIGHDLLPTPHPKILRAREAGQLSANLEEVFRRLHDVVDAGDTLAARQLVFRWVEPARVIPPDLAIGHVATVQV